MTSQFSKNILCIGAGYVGGPTMAMIAYKCPGYRVEVVDINAERIARWNSADLPIYEPGLTDIVEAVRGRNLFFTTDLEGGIDRAEIIFVSVNTPTKMFGVGAGMAADLQYWEKTARQILASARTPKIIVEKSTLPVKTAQAMERILLSGGTGVAFEVLSNPEFLAEGSAMQDLESPDRVLIGSRLTPEGLKARQALVDLYAHWVAPERIITSDIWSSELAKLVANAFLAQRISSINAISALCEATEADVAHVSKAVGTDTRIGSKFLQASVGFGGSCFQKDILNLVYICRSYNLHEVANYWEQVILINNYQKERFVLKMLAAMFNTLAGKRICLMGFAFKANTGDTRESPAIYVTRKLVDEQAHVVITDPQALENARHDLTGLPESAVSFVDDPYEAARGCHALGIMTEWALYAELDYHRIYEVMEKPAFVFDGRNVIHPEQLFEIGFNVYPIGQPPLTRL